MIGKLRIEPRRGRKRAPLDVPRVDLRAERLARRLALAHWIERKIEAGELRNYAHAARVLGVSRARVSQFVGMLFRPPETRLAGPPLVATRSVSTEQGTAG